MNFDRVAGIYDATRALPGWVVNRVADRIVDAAHAGPETRFLELGIGTGRIAAPLVSRGYPYTGVDISERMLAVLQGKLSGSDNLELLQANVTRLPLPDHSFDVILNVHLLHLVPEWRKAIDEALRLLTADGFFVQGHDTSLPGSPGEELRTRWWNVVVELGGEGSPEYGTWANTLADLTGRGAMLTVFHVAEWSEDLRPIDLLDALRNRVFSRTWPLPDALLNAVYERMLTWASERFGDLKKPLPNPQEFTLTVAQFPKEGGHA